MDSDIDPDSLLQTQSINDSITQSLQPLAGMFVALTVFSIVLTIAIIVVWILSLIRRRKIQNAILDIQTTLHEMNERDKSQYTLRQSGPDTAPTTTDA